MMFFENSLPPLCLILFLLQIYFCLFHICLFYPCVLFFTLNIFNLSSVCLNALVSYLWSSWSWLLVFCTPKCLLQRKRNHLHQHQSLQQKKSLLLQVVSSVCHPCSLTPCLSCLWEICWGFTTVFNFVCFVCVPVSCFLFARSLPVI